MKFRKDRTRKQQERLELLVTLPLIVILMVCMSMTIPHTVLHFLSLMVK